MDENKKVLFIINKFSGAGYQSGVEGRIVARCAELNLEPSIEFTQGRGHAIELARQAAISKQFEVVYAVGGDGTVNEVARGIATTQQIMGILPKGSGNGLARHLGIPMNFKKSLDYMGSTSVLSMDSFTVNNHLSVNVSGIGFDGHVANLFGKNGNRGFWGYSKLVLKEFFRYREFKGKIEVDDQPYDLPAFIIAFANSSQFGNNARIAPQASVCDGILDVSFIRKVPLYRIPGFAGKMFTGHLAHSEYVVIKPGKRITLSFTEPMPYHIDGEGMEPTRDFVIQMEPASIRMLVPTHVLI